MPDGSPALHHDMPGAKPDFRIIDRAKWVKAVQQHRCWICGEILGRYYAFTIGPMCAVNRISSEPPSHRECAIFAAQACPFLIKPQVARRISDLPETRLAPAGNHIDRNPGAALVWVTKSYTVIPVPRREANGIVQNEGYLIEVGEPTETLWFCEGRTATREEVLHSMETGLPFLREVCENDDQLALLDQQYQAAQELIPA